MLKKQDFAASASDPMKLTLVKGSKHAQEARFCCFCLGPDEFTLVKGSNLASKAGFCCFCLRPDKSLLVKGSNLTSETGFCCFWQNLTKIKCKSSASMKDKSIYGKSTHRQNKSTHRQNKSTHHSRTKSHRSRANQTPSQNRSSTALTWSTLHGTYSVHSRGNMRRQSAVRNLSSRSTMAPLS